MTKKRTWKAQFERERAAKRSAIDAYVDLVGIGRLLAEYQPAAHAKTRQEADLWGRFYKLLHDAPVTFGPGLSRLPTVRKSGK